MGERVQNLMPTGKLVDLMEGINISRSMFPIIILKGRAMEGCTTGTDTQQDHS
jgi:hypothetical protein